MAGDRLGEWLVERGLCTQAQVDEAIQSKIVFGGRLGTNLVELGALGLDALEESLAALHGRERAPLDWLQEPRSEALQQLPREAAARWGALPLRTEGDTLHAALLDPHREQAVAGVAEACGRSVEPYTVAELRLGVLLEHHYGIPRDERFVRASEAAGLPDGRERADGRADAEDLIDEETFASLHSEWQQRAAGAGAAPDDEEIVLTEVAPREPPGVAALEAALLGAPDRDAVASRTLGLARRFSEGAALLAVRGGVVTGFRGDGEGVPERIEGILLPVEVDSVVARAAAHGNPFRGAAPEGLDQTLLRALGRAGAREILVQPIAIRERVVNLLYADAGEAPLADTHAAALAAVASLASRAYHRLVLEHKRRAA
jgi:hypothetical protein